MAKVTRVIQLPAPVTMVPAVTGWGIYELRFNPTLERATVTLIAVDASGAQVAGGATLSLAVDGADYRALYSAQLADSLTNLIATVGQSKGVLAEGTTVVDATP